jgi:hypothetical protein
MLQATPTYLSIGVASDIESVEYIVEYIPEQGAWSWRKQLASISEPPTLALP